MKKVQRKTFRIFLCSTLLGAATALAQPTVITFDDLPDAPLTSLSMQVDRVISTRPNVSLSYVPA